jgi:acetylglutamate kinase
VLNPVYAGSGPEVKTAQVRAEEVARSVAAELMHKEMALLEAMGKRWL